MAIPLGRQFKSSNWLLLFTVVLPVILATIYYTAFASDIYISESKFVVKSPDKPASAGLGLVLKTAGFSTSGDEIYAVQAFVDSRDALRGINQNQAFAKAYDNPSISIFDRFGSLGWKDTFEELYKYYQKKVTIATDSSTNITTLSVRAYDPVSAQKFNSELLKMSEQMVNRLNTRGRNDMIQYAQAEVDKAQAASRDASLALAKYRNSSGVLDPKAQGEVQMQMISKLQDQLIASKAELAQLKSLAPQNPRIPAILTQISTLNKEIAKQTALVVGGTSSLASNAVEYQKLQIDDEYAAKQLAAAMASLDEARNEALRKQAYLERVADPSMPDSATEPHRARGIFAAFVLGLVAFTILRMLLAGVKEHAQ